jgi:nucleotide-binding universal stress UspA family protein
MTAFTKILIPHDFSECADCALAIAGDLARRYEASATLLHVHEPRYYATPEAYMLYQSDELAGLIAALNDKLAGLAQTLRAAGAKTVNTSVRPGANPADEIVRHAVDGGYDLIVMSTHGRKGLSHALLGSVAERVVRTAPCPVLTVRMPVPTATRGN